MQHKKHATNEQAEALLAEVKHHFPALALKSCDGDFAVYKGIIGFSADYKVKGRIEDEFEVEITFPLASGGEPTAKETGGRIPREPRYHINGDGTMCLGAPLEVRRKRKKDSSLYAFITNQVIHFFYSYCYKERNGASPFGELSHGSEGLVEHYKELLETDSNLVVLELLKIIVADHYRGHLICPCGSSERLRKCHGPQIQEMRKQQTREQFLEDFLCCFEEYADSEQKLPRHFLNKKLYTYLKSLN